MADKNKVFRSGQPRAFIVEPRRILIRGVNWLGDAVMSTPALQRFARAIPQRAHCDADSGESCRSLEVSTEHQLRNHFSPGTAFSPSAGRLQGEKFDTAWSCPIRLAPPLKYGWQELGNVSAIAAPGAICF